ncbi:PREDICTED: uncharacterized protein LOC109215075 [Nicotiana attenuata]|uniref:uncharacterized protein LOC109215075 n=1 Tax=Nicotiana attenuata TaxID=49451 RepID=UPI000905B42B|nr:PREDICTED: uncharacterized protein LOC109215075 [Nicotiana attenuata]
MNLDSACGGSCMAKPYSEIQLLLNTFTANDNNWQGDGDSRKAVKKKLAGLLELDEVSAMRAEIAKLANQMTRITMQQPQPMQQLIQSTRKFVGLPHEDPQRLTLFPFSLIGEAKEWLNKEPASSIRTWNDLARKFLIKFFPTKKTKVLRSQILGFEQRAGKTLRQAWERYKKLLRDCPYHFQTDEVLGHTFVDGLDDASKMNLDSACGGDGDSRKAVKQKSAGLLEFDEVSAMRAEIAKLANQMTRITMQQPHPMQQVQQMTICCELCGDTHMSDMCPTNPESIYYMGQQNWGPPNQHAQYGNSYNPNWRNHPNFSRGGNQQSQNQYRPQGGFNQPQRPPQQMEESTNVLLKKLLIDNQQLRTDFRNLERQMGQLATNQNTRPAGALPSDTEKNPQVNAVTLRNGRELEEVPNKRKDKPIPEGELIPKVTNEPKKTAEILEPLEAPRPPPPFPQRFFTIPVRIGNIDVGRALCDFGGKHKFDAPIIVQAIGSGSSKNNYCDVAAG